MKVKSFVLASVLSILAASTSFTTLANPACKDETPSCPDTPFEGRSCCGGFQFIIGADYYHAWRRTKGNYNLIIPKSYPGGTIYIGGRWDYIGLELGYDSSVRIKKNWTIPTGTTIGGFTAPFPVSGVSKARFHGLHLDVLGYLPLDCCDQTELFGSIGYGTAGFRIGIGANYMLTDCLGLRAKVGYEYNARVCVSYPTAFANYGLNRHPFTHAGTVSVGAFYKF